MNIAVCVNSGLSRSGLNLCAHNIACSCVLLPKPDPTEKKKNVRKRSTQLQGVGRAPLVLSGHGSAPSSAIRPLQDSYPPTYSGGAFEGLMAQSAAPLTIAGFGVVRSPDSRLVAARGELRPPLESVISNQGRKRWQKLAQSIGPRLYPEFSGGWLDVYFAVNGHSSRLSPLHDRDVYEFTDEKKGFKKGGFEKTSFSLGFHF